MEVHHPHHLSHKKKWKEYVLEFFMLFLAISLGFFAENQREHYVEKERAQELLSSFINDVETNISFTDSLVKNNRKTILKNDSAIIYLLDNSKIKLDSLFNLLPIGSYRYLNNNETYEQMRSSGSLRYIKDTVLLRKVINYNNASKSAEFRSVTQEYEYAAHEYTNAIQKWMPNEIAAKRQVTQLLGKKFYPIAVKNNEDSTLVQRLFHSDQGKTFFIEGEELNNLKKDLIPIIARKTFLTTASMGTAYIVYTQANELIEYYNEHHKTAH